MRTSRRVNLLFVAILATTACMLSTTAWAHRGGGPNDPCERRLGASLVHLTLYQPNFDPDAEYCDEVPREGGEMKEFLEKFVKENPELLPARLAGGSGASGGARGGGSGAAGAVDIDKIRPGMSAEELDRVRQEIARVASQTLRGI